MDERCPDCGEPKHPRRTRSLEDELAAFKLKALKMKASTYLITPGDITGYVWRRR